MVNVILDAKNQSFKLCSVDGIDVVSYCSENHVGRGLVILEMELKGGKIWKFRKF